MLLSACAPIEDRPGSRTFDGSKPLYEFSESELDALLVACATDNLAVPDRAVRFASKFVGQPYRLHLLGEFPYETYDSDPLYCLSASDCVTFVENVYAMSMARDWSSFFDRLMRLRYKDARIGILTRNHFTEADWNVNNEWAFDDVTNQMAPEAIRPMRIAVDRAAFFRKYGMGDTIPVQIFKTTYIPRSALASVETRLKPGDIVEFVRGTREAPYVGHMGLIGEKKAGRMLLIHSAEPRVREEPLRDYVEASTKILGVKILRYRLDPTAE
ncbi:MAG: DUF1460 domain-containing protein [Phycisphaerae bacterium]|nr:DUF1460 domain-containing protein [Phycisphaerae bacterium]